MTFTNRYLQKSWKYFSVERWNNLGQESKICGVKELIGMIMVFITLLTNKYSIGRKLTTFESSYRGNLQHYSDKVGNSPRPISAVTSAVLNRRSVFTKNYFS